MITNTMNAIAAPVPYFRERNDSWYDRYAGVSVVPAGAPLPIT